MNQRHSSEPSDPAASPEPDAPERHQGLVGRIEDAAIEAEYATGERETSEAEARSHIAVRLARITVGFLVVIIGIILLPLPGPGWVIIAGGFVILSRDFAWADRTVRLIRRRVPGVPEDGRIPPSSWAMIIGVTVGAAAIAYFFGDDLRSFL